MRQGNMLQHMARRHMLDKRTGRSHVAGCLNVVGNATDTGRFRGLERLCRTDGHVGRRGSSKAACVNAESDIVLQVLSGFADPLTLMVGTALLLLSTSAFLVRIAMAASAALLTGLERWDDGFAAWDAALLACSILGGLLGAQLVLSVVAPVAWLGLGAMRSAVCWWRGER